MIISITGTPGTGKTYFAKHLAKMTGFRDLELNELIVKEKLYDDFDKKNKTFDVDTDKLSRFMDMLLKKYSYDKNDKEQSRIHKELKNMVGKKYVLKKFILKKTKSKKNFTNNIIIDSHLSQFITSDFCIVIKSDIKDIAKRLAKRKYSKTKMQENIQSEIFDICLEQAQRNSKNIIIIEN